MTQLLAFTRKEFLEQSKNHRFLILLLIFGLIGIMSPAIAKLTPWMFTLLSGELAKNGIAITNIQPDALMAWTQYFKNIPMALIIFIVLSGTILTAEYQKGTLVILFAKGLKRWKVLLAKLILLLVCWTLGCALSFLITYGYSEYFWDNSTVSHIFFSVFCFYLLGVWLISLLLLSSVFQKSASGVILSVGLGFLLSYLAGFLPAIKEYVPTWLMESAGLLSGTKSPGSYLAAAAITLSLTIFNIAGSVLCFRKKVI